MDVLVCIKRVPDSSGTVLLTDDGQRVDARHVGYTVSPHEECAVELGVQLASETDGTVTVLTLGTQDAVEQLRNALAVGCSAGVLIEADPDQFGPADVSAEIAAVVAERAASGGSGFDLVLLGNDAADTGDFQVGVRLGYALGWPVLTGISMATVSADRLEARGDGPEGTEIFDLDLPAVLTVMEGGVSPRYPSIPGRMKAKRAPVETREPSGTGNLAGTRRVKLTLPPEEASSVQILGEGAAAAPAVAELLEKLGVWSR